jgi:TRAP-type C4-dicarboxylate transport system substrate-binding protein
MTLRFVRLAIVLATFTIGTMPALRAQGKPLTIRLGTVVPKDSLWDQTLQHVRQEWRRISSQSVEITVYPGGGLGDEIEMVKKVRLGSIQAVALSSVGLAHIDEGVSCLQVPLMLRSYAELDYVRDRIAARLEQRIEAKGFKVLNWADGGWVHTFSKQPARTPDELRAMKLFTSAGDPETEKLFKGFGFHVVPLSMSNMMLSLQTNMIDAFSTVPLFAQLQGSFAQAPYMSDLMWTPLVGGTVISKAVWDQIPASYRPAMLDAARDAGTKLRPNIRAQGDSAIVEMQKRGLKVVKLDPAAQAAWQSVVEGAYPKLRGQYCPADLFDEVLRLRDDLRRSGAGK